MGGDALKPDLLIDLGGTNIRFGLAAEGALLEGTFESHAHQGAPLEALIRDFVARQASRGVGRMALAVAAPLSPEPGAPIRMTNGPYRFRPDRLAEAAGAESIVVVNDFEAVARAVPSLGVDDKMQLHPGQPISRAPVLVVGPGTGLGVGLLVPSGRSWLVVPTEGGHATLASPAAEYDELLVATRDHFGHASAERLLCGDGLRALDSWYATGRLDPDHERSPTAVSAAAGDGDATAQQAIRAFFDLLAAFIGSAALITGARGGIVLAGGILPRLSDHLDVESFRARMTGKGRYRDYLEAMPLWLVVHPCPAMPGLARISHKADLSRA